MEGSGSGSGSTLEENEDGRYVTSKLGSELEFIILWRGEGTKGYCLQFRHFEFRNALCAVLGPDRAPPLVTFLDATPSVDELDDLHGAIQYVHIMEDFTTTTTTAADSAATATATAIAATPITPA